jgi:hypothetical protein
LFQRRNANHAKHAKDTKPTKNALYEIVLRGLSGLALPRRNAEPAERAENSTHRSVL